MSSAEKLRYQHPQDGSEVYRCPVEGCDWRGARSSVYQHATGEHNRTATFERRQRDAPPHRYGCSTADTDTILLISSLSLRRQDGPIIIFHRPDGGSSGQQVECPVEGCEWSGSTTGAYQHARDKHGSKGQLGHRDEKVAAQPIAARVRAHRKRKAVSAGSCLMVFSSQGSRTANVFVAGCGGTSAPAE